MRAQEQRLIKIHAVGGIFFGLLFYVIMFFSMFSLMQNYIKAWEKPSRHFASIVKNEDIALSKYVDPILADPDIPKNNFKIRLPGLKDDMALLVSPAFSNQIVLNPNTGEKLEDESRRWN